MTRVAPSDPRYAEIALALHFLGVALNPGCWYGVEVQRPEQAATIAATEIALEELLADVVPAGFTDYFNA